MTRKQMQAKLLDEFRYGVEFLKSGKTGDYYTENYVYSLPMYISLFKSNLSIKAIMMVAQNINDEIRLGRMDYDPEGEIEVSERSNAKERASEYVLDMARK